MYFISLHYCLINIHIFDYPDSRLSGLFIQVPTSLDNRGSTVPSSRRRRPLTTRDRRPPPRQLGVNQKLTEKIFFFCQVKKSECLKKRKTKICKSIKTLDQNRKDAKPDQKKFSVVQGKLRLCANLKGRKRHVRKSYTEKSLDILKYIF